MQRILCFALAAAMLLSLAACDGDNKQNKDDDVTAAPVTESTQITEQPTVEPTTGSHDVISLDFINTFDTKPAIDEQVVYEKGGVWVKATAIRYDTVSGPQIMLSVKNDGDKEILLQNDHTAVNGFMIKPEIDVKIPPRKKLETPMSLPYLGLAMADIRSLREVEFSLHILDSKTFAVIDTTPTVSLALKNVSDKQPVFDDQGQIAYDAKGVKVVLKGVKHDTLFDSESVLLVYMENNTDKTISVGNAKLTVNGYDITTAMLTLLLPGKCAVDKIELFDKELEEYGISSLDSVKVSFEVDDYDNWKEIAVTDTVSVDLATEAPTEATTDTQPTE